MATKVRVEDSVAYHIYRCARLLRRDLLDMTAEEGLEFTPEQWFILNRLRREDGQSQGELGDEVFTDRPNLARCIQGMERQGLVSRLEDPEDGRRVRVWLTAHGKRAHDKMAKRVQKSRKRLFGGLSARRQKETIAALTKISEACIDEEE
ncbi:MAG: MarR family transcriptional regulator [Myxococcota bacterium]